MLRSLSAEDLDAVVALHLRILPWSTNAQLGAGHVTGLYRALFERPETFGYGWWLPGGLAGFVVATEDWRVARSALFARYGLVERVRLLAHALRRPADLLDLVEGRYRIPWALRALDVAAEIVTWVTDPEAPRPPSPAVETMDAALRHLAERGHRAVTAQVLRRSERPNRAYLNMGGRIHRTFWQNHLYVIPCAAGV